MKLKLPILFLVAVLVGGGVNWTLIKFSWQKYDSLNQQPDAQAIERQKLTGSQTVSPVPILVPAGVTLSPTPSARLDTPPTEISITFPFPPRSGGLTVQLDETVLLQPADDLVLRDKSFVFVLPATASSGIYTVDYSGCPDTTLDNCISGTYGFVVK